MIDFYSNCIGCQINWDRCEYRDWDELHGLMCCAVGRWLEGEPRPCERSPSPFGHQAKHSKPFRLIP